MRVKGEKRNVSSYPWKLCGRYTFHAFLSTPFQPPRRPHTRKLVHPLWICFSYAWLFKRVCQPSLCHPAYLRFFLVPPGLCVCVYVCVGHPCVWPSLLSPCARFHPFLSHSLSLSGPTSVHGSTVRGNGGGERLLNFLPVFYYSGKLSTVFQARALYGRFR